MKVNIPYNFHGSYGLLWKIPNKYPGELPFPVHFRPWRESIPGGVRLVVLTQTWKAEICRLGEMRMRRMTGRLFQISLWFQIWFIFNLTGVNGPKLTIIFQLGWKHQLDKVDEDEVDEDEDVFFCYVYVMSRGVILWRQFLINSSFDDNWRCPWKIRKTHTQYHT